MTTKRRLLLDELDAWRREGLLDEPTHRLLRSRYELAPASDALDGELGAAAVPAAPARPAVSREDADGAERRGFAADAMQFVGGLLLGAGLVALVVFLDVAEDAAPYVLLLLGALMVAPGVLGALRGARAGLVEAGLSGGLVPILVGVAMSLGGDGSADLVVPLVVAAASVGILLLRKGDGPTTLLAGGAYTVATAAATILQEDLIFDVPSMATRWTWALALLALGALLFLWRRKPWAETSMGALVLPATIAFALLLEPLELESVGYELAIGAWLGALLALGIVTGSRGLVTGAAAGLTIDAVAFAFDIGGPGTAVVVLLALGGLLVWQAENVRGYFRGARRSPRRSS